MYSIINGSCNLYCLDNDISYNTIIVCVSIGQFTGAVIR